jgi:hypothetical protein
MKISFYHYESGAVTIKLTGNIICLTWHQPVSQTTHKRSYLKALVLARKACACKWLVDARLLGKLPDENFLWTVREFYPNLLPVNDSVTSIAYLLNEESYQDMVNSNGSSPVVAQGSMLQIELFRNENSAKAWLDPIYSLAV